MGLRIAEHDVKRLLIVGFGVTGRAVAAFCVRQGLRFSLSEAGALAPSDETWLRQHADDYETGGHTDRLLDGVDAVVASPGAPKGLGLFTEATRRQIPVFSELDVACAETATERIVAVTGTNGKSTTVSLIGALLESTGVRGCVAGNIGRPFLDVADRAGEWDVAVLEVSSFQLEQSVIFRPHVGVLLNLAPNHLERHGSMAAYTAAKARLFAHQMPSDVAILHSSLATVVDHGRGSPVFYDRPFPPLPRGSEGIGEVRRLDLAAAVAACTVMVPGFDATRQTVDELGQALYLPYRQEPVGTIDGVRVINDSKATSPAATMAALRSVCGPVVLLLGGRSKRGGYDELAQFLALSPRRAVVVFGEARSEIAEHLTRAGVDHSVVQDLASAVSAGMALARPGDALLLSPACSSFDAFGSFEERGEAFNRLVRQHKRFSGAGVADG